MFLPQLINFLYMYYGDTCSLILPGFSPSALEHSKPELSLERKLSEFNLGYRPCDSGLGSIRKTSSFIHGTNFAIGLNTPAHYYQQHRSPNFHIGGGALQSSAVPATTFEEPSQHSGGLTMQIRSSANTLAKPNEIQHSSSMAGGLFSNSSADTAVNNTHVGGLIANASTDSLNANRPKVCQ